MYFGGHNLPHKCTPRAENARSFLNVAFGHWEGSAESIAESPKHKFCPLLLQRFVPSATMKKRRQPRSTAAKKNRAHPRRVSLPNEVIRLIAHISHPQVSRALKCLNHALSHLITTTDLNLGEMNWRLTRRDIEDSREECLLWAARNGLDAIVSRLLHITTRSEGMSEETEAIYLAAENGHAQIVQLLLATGAPMCAFTFDNVVQQSHVSVLSITLSQSSLPHLRTFEAAVDTLIMDQGEMKNWRCSLFS